MFLRELGIDGNRRRAARAAGVDSATIYRHRADDPAFRELWDTAIDHAGEYLEAEAWRRATEGVVKPLTCAKGLILDKAGRRVTVREYSDTVLLALLRGARPQKYRERASLDLTSGGHSLMEDLALTLARLRDTAADGMLITDGTCDTNPTTPAE